MSHSSWGNASPYDLTCHRRKTSLTTVPVSLVLEGSQLRVADSVALSPAAVFLCPTPPASEPDASRSKSTAGASPLTGSVPISVRSHTGHTGNLIVTVCVSDCICQTVSGSPPVDPENYNGPLMCPPILIATTVALAVLNVLHSAHLLPDVRMVAMLLYHCPSRSTAQSLQTPDDIVPK